MDYKIDLKEYHRGDFIGALDVKLRSVDNRCTRYPTTSRNYIETFDLISIFPKEIESIIELMNSDELGSSNHILSLSMLYGLVKKE